MHGISMGCKAVSTSTIGASKLGQSFARGEFGIGETYANIGAHQLGLLTNGNVAAWLCPAL